MLGFVFFLSVDTWSRTQAFRSDCTIGVYAFCGRHRCHVHTHQIYVCTGDSNLQRADILIWKQNTPRHCNYYDWNSNDDILWIVDLFNPPTKKKTQSSATSTTAFCSTCRHVGTKWIWDMWERKQTSRVLYPNSMLHPTLAAFARRSVSMYSSSSPYVGPGAFARWAPLTSIGDRSWLISIASTAQGTMSTQDLNVSCSLSCVSLITLWYFIRYRIIPLLARKIIFITELYLQHHDGGHSRWFECCMIAYMCKSGCIWYGHAVDRRMYQMSQAFA